MHLSMKRFFCTMLVCSPWWPTMLAMPTSHDQRADAFCEDPDYTSDTLQLISLTKILQLLSDTGSRNRYEVSSITRSATTGGFILVLDDTSTVIHLGQDLTGFARPENNLVYSMSGDFVSQFEGIVAVGQGDSYLVASESVGVDGAFYPIIQEIQLPQDGGSSGSEGYRVLQECVFAEAMETDNKGIEGLALLQVPPTSDNARGLILLALCEGNHCASGNSGDERGKGIILAAVHSVQPDGTCSWEVTKRIHIPPKADFEDYSDLAFNPSRSHLSVISQQDSSVFIGEFDAQLLEFVGNGDVYNFPRNQRCEVEFCNAEGIVWLDDVRFAVVSDRAKKDDPHFCLAGEQSIAIFAIR